jgi:hypothetical protein
MAFGIKEKAVLITAFFTSEKLVAANYVTYRLTAFSAAPHSIVPFLKAKVNSKVIQKYPKILVLFAY